MHITNELEKNMYNAALGHSGHLPLLQENASLILIGGAFLCILAFFAIIDWIFYVLKWVAKIFGFVITVAAVGYIIYLICAWGLHEVLPHLKL